MNSPRVHGRGTGREGGRALPLAAVTQVTLLGAEAKRAERAPGA